MEKEINLVGIVIAEIFVNFSYMFEWIVSCPRSNPWDWLDMLHKACSKAEWLRTS